MDDVTRLSANEVEARFSQGRLSRRDVLAWVRYSAKMGRIYLPHYRGGAAYAGGAPLTYARLWLERLSDAEERLFAKRRAWHAKAGEARE